MGNWPSDWAWSKLPVRPYLPAQYPYDNENIVVLQQDPDLLDPYHLWVDPANHAKTSGVGLWQFNDNFFFSELTRGTIMTVMGAVVMTAERNDDDNSEVYTLVQPTPPALFEFTGVELSSPPAGFPEATVYFAGPRCFMHRIEPKADA